MPKSKYCFQERKNSFAKKFFEKGLNASSYILLGLKEAGEDFLTNLPDSYPEFAVMKWFFGVGKYKKKHFKKEVIRINVDRLKKQGLIAQDPKKKFYFLTEEGKQLLIYIRDRYDILKKPWDGKFRIVIFDIPENKKRWRHWLRKELYLLEFKQLQRSVYLGKHPLPQGFYQEIAQAGLSSCVFILTVGEIDRKDEIIRLFEEQ